MGENEIELKPCPFCGDEAPGIEGQMHKELGFVYYHVYCTACGASGLWHLIKERAISAWNRRHAEEPAEAEWTGERGEYICSNCGEESPNDAYWRSPFCHVCGRKMKNGRN